MKRFSRTICSFFLGTACAFVLCCTGDNLADAGFIVSWRIEDEFGEPLTCDMLGADHIRFEVVDSNNVTQVVRAPCANMRMETDDWTIAAGKGTVFPSMRTEGDIVIAESEPIVFNFVSGKLSNVLPEVFFVLPSDKLEGFGPNIVVKTVLQDANGQEISCAAQGIAFFSFTLTDAKGRMFELGDTPCDTKVTMRVKMNSVPSPGEGELEIAFRNATLVRVSQQTTKIQIPRGDAEFGPVSLPLTPRTLGGDAGVSWTWTLDGEPLRDKTCHDLGIDYVSLFVWDDAKQSWWTDRKTMELPCSAFDHSDDDALFGEDVYSGFYLPSFGDEGLYHLFLGFYRRYSDVDVAMNSLESNDLVAYDDAYLGNENGLSGALYKNEELASGINQMHTELRPLVHEVGTLAISMFFELDEITQAVGGCPQASLSEMGIYLYNSAGPSTSLNITDSYPCQDAVSYWDLPVLEKPYTLVTYGLNDRGILSWYAICDGLVPEISIGLPISPHFCVLSLTESD